jgi:PAS domain S-box-containing protein
MEPMTDKGGAARPRAGAEDYRSLVESQLEMVCRFRVDGTILFANPAYAASLGTTPEALAGRNFWSYVPEPDQPGVRAMLERIRPDEPVVTIENRFRTEQGERWILWANRGLKFDADGRVIEAQSSGVDISERRRMEAALREEARTLETLNRVGRTLAADLDLERTVQAVTDAATQVTGAQFGAFFYNVRNAAGESYQLFTLAGAPREAFEKFGMPRNTAVFGPTFAGEGVIRLDDVTKDPRYGKNAPHRGMPQGHLPVRSYLALPVVSRSGEVLGGLFFGHPEPGVFTERAERLAAGIAAQAAVALDNARLFEQRRQLIEQLREADRRKDEFLATLSHELRNPLAPLRSSLDLLRISGAASPGTAPVLGTMERQLSHLVRLVDDLLEVSRISHGSFALRRERVEVAAVVRNALETSEPLVRGARHTLEVSLPEQPLWLDGDPVRLAQILANLLNNAAKYTPPGGRIALRARREGDALVLSVRDNGPGIPPEALPRLFEMFSRGEGEDRSRQGGLGIGLALARRLAEMHGGSIAAHSEGTGAGAEFTVRLPLARAPAPGAGSAPAPSAPLAGLRILVVDDNTDARDSLGALLRFLGAEVRLAHDGPEALGACEAYRPDAVLLDIGMPGMDGYEVARRIRSASDGERPLLVALTGWGQRDDRRSAREAGFDEHLVKPVDVGMLQAVFAARAAARQEQP